MTLQTHEELEMLNLIRGLNAKLDEVLASLRTPAPTPPSDTESSDEPHTQPEQSLTS